jgi:CheY-like chemotaxis protein
VRIAGAIAVDAILMEISMPRLDGVETTQAIRTGAGGGASAGAPVIALTAHALPAEIEGFRATGMGDVLTKPLRREALAAALSRIGCRTVLASARGVGDPGAAPSGGDPSLPILDPSFLAELRADIGAERTERFLGDFLRDGAELAAGPPNGTLDPPSREALRKRVHHLAGSAALCGACRLRGHLAEAESALKRGEPAVAEFAVLPPLWAATAAALSGQT